MRIPPDLDPELQEALRLLWQEIDRVGGSRNVDIRGRRWINAGNAIQAQDYVTLRDLEVILGKELAKKPPAVVNVGGTPNTTPPTGGGGEPPTIPPTQTLPTATFTVNPVTLPEGGGTVTLTWVSTNATSVRLGSILGPVDVLPLAGTTTRTITATTIFSLWLYGPGGQAQIHAVVGVGTIGEIPPQPTTGRLTHSGTGFLLDGADFDILGTTAFTLFHDWAYYSQTYARDQIQLLMSHGMRSPRIMATLHWATVGPILIGRSVVIDPTLQADFYTKLRQFCEMARNVGLVPYWVVLGDAVEAFESAAVRDTVVRGVANVLRDFPCLVEIINEPESVGLPSYPDPYDEAQRLAYVYKTVDSINPLATSGGYTAAQMDRPPADWMGYQGDRLHDMNGWGWVHAQIVASAVRANGQPRAVVHGEPINAFAQGRSDVDEDPNHHWGSAIVAKILKIGYTFHSHDLLGSAVGQAEHQPQMLAFLDGWRRVSSRMAGEEFYARNTGLILGASPWSATEASVVYGRHNGLQGKAFAMDVPGGFNVSAYLNPGWAATMVETRGTGVLIDVNRIT